MKANEMLDIILHCVPVDGGFLHPDTGEFFSDDDLMKIEGDLNNAIDYLGMKTLETDKRAESKEALSKHYDDEAKLDKKRAERLRFILGYLTQGKKTVCEHITVAFYGKQERLALKCKESQLPQELKKPTTVFKADTTLIREKLEAHDPLALEYAYIDTRKKATVK